jgi:hypothetical protein
LEENKGINAFVRFVRGEAKGVNEFADNPSILGTISGTNLSIDGFSEVIPRSDYLVLEQKVTLNPGGIATIKLNLDDGDRVLCVPAGSTYVVVGQVK